MTGRDYEIFHGHAIDGLQQLPSGIAQTCITSPPYYGLRNYKTEPILWGGDPGCSHDFKAVHPPGFRGSDTKPGKMQHEGNKHRENLTSALCSLCGAWSGELGLEPTPEMYIEHLVLIFREVRRVLHDTGVLFLNLGDSYNGSSMLGGLKPKDLMGMPWRTAIALQADGWFLRSDIIWSKNPMPESVADRPTKSHEYFFMLSKSRHYYYDVDGFKENSADGNGRRARTVWQINTKPYKEAHFACMPPALAERAILLSSSEAGQCPVCGAPWNRLTTRTKEADHLLSGAEQAEVNADHGRFEGMQRCTYLTNPKAASEYAASKVTVGWAPSCGCTGYQPVPQLILDPFSGSGTTGQAALTHGRKYIGVELNESYICMSHRRIHAALKPPEKKLRKSQVKEMETSNSQGEVMMSERVK